MNAQGTSEAAIRAGFGHLKLWITAVIIVLAVALSFRGDSRSAATEQTAWAVELSRDLHQALETLLSLHARCVTDPLRSPHGDTVYFLVPSETLRRRVDRISVYVDKEMGGLWVRRDGESPRLLGATVDRLSLETEATPQGDERVMAVKLSAARAQTGGLAMRRSLERLLQTGALCES